jgi:protein involved in polysaccharide export with SLBB domain
MLCFFLLPFFCFADDYIDKEGTFPAENSSEQEFTSTKMEVDEAFFRDYIIKKGNIVYISVKQDVSMNGEYKVNSMGEIDFPLVGKIKIEGKTTIETREHIQALLEKDFIRNPIVTLDLIDYTKANIHLSGELVTPGSYPITNHTTLTDAIKLAGGFTKFANQSMITINNSINSQSDTFNYDLIIKGQQKNPRLKGNESIVVDALIPVKVDGGVVKPGITYIQPGLSLRKVIEMAGGFSKMADIKDIIVRTATEENKYLENKYDYEKIMNAQADMPIILANDHIIIGECSKKFNVFGKTLCIK